MPKMPKVKQAFIAFDSELRKGAQQRAPTNSELFGTQMNADFRDQAKIEWTRKNHSLSFFIFLPKEVFICVYLGRSASQSFI